MTAVSTLLRIKILSRFIGPSEPHSQETNHRQVYRTMEAKLYFNRTCVTDYEGQYTRGNLLRLTWQVCGDCCLYSSYMPASTWRTSTQPELSWCRYKKILWKHKIFDYQCLVSMKNAVAETWEPLGGLAMLMTDYWGLEKLETLTIGLGLLPLILATLRCPYSSKQLLEWWEVGRGARADN